jgi:hypothetical protein
MNRRAQWVLLSICVSVSTSLGACAYDPSKDAYEVPEHIRQRETLRQDSYAEPRLDNASIDPQVEGSFCVQHCKTPVDASPGQGDPQQGELPCSERI